MRFISLWENNIEMDLKEAAWKNGGGSCEGPVASIFEHRNDILGSVKCWE
jgi:hypothetical protein